MAQMYKIGKCSVCGKEKEIIAKGKCKTCYSIEYTSKLPTDFFCPICKLKTQQYATMNKCYKCYMKEYNKINYQKNKEKIKEQNIKYYEENRQMCIEKRKQYNEKNAETIKEYQKQYHDERKEKHE
jgi:hypothetical protein